MQMTVSESDPPVPRVPARQQARLEPAASPVAAYLGRLAPTSRRTQLGSLHLLARLLAGGQADAWAVPWWYLRFEHTSALRAVIADRYSPATGNRLLSALRGVLRDCWRMGLISAEDLGRAIDLRPIPGTRLPAGRAVPPDQVGKLIQACLDDPRPAGARDAAMIAIAYGLGLRRAEVAALRMEDYDHAARTLTVRGKGGKERLGHVSDDVAAHLERWLTFRGAAPGPLIVPIDKTNRVGARPVSAQTVYNAVRQRAVAAEVGPTAPHDLRRSFISHLLDAGADLSVVQQLAGHAQVSTTTRYDRRGEPARRRAASLSSHPAAP